MPSPPVILSIAGYDPSSGAGVTADLKTAAALDCYAITCITALTVQSTQGVFAVEAVRPQIVRDTLTRLHDDFEIAAVRVGMLGSGEVATEVASFLERTRVPHLVVDPVIRSSSGRALLDDAGQAILRDRILPLAILITPNLHEAVRLADAEPLPDGSRWSSAQPRIQDLARRLHALGVQGVLITGGHLAEPVDFLSLREDHPGSASLPAVHVFAGERIASSSTHGTGCALAMAIACLLARGVNLPSAVRDAKSFVQSAIRNAFPLGRGLGPLNHLFRLGQPGPMDQ
jgi:hydroxymethylpyrimidine/phosphomethylpyrimidine kinase